MIARLGFIGVLLIAGACARSSSVPPIVAANVAPLPLPAQIPSRISRAQIDLRQLADRAMPATVLLLNYKPNGAIGYGAGLIVGKDGLVLTSRHVISGAKRLGAMLHRQDRTSYTPMDGGLSRYIFENHRDIVDATLVDEESASDLALVRIAADTSAVVPLEIAAEPLHIGDPILAVGHPQEAVWSFTSGVVSGLPNGAIQHDAIVSQGSSGGPILDERGRVVGVNIAKVTSETPGFAFARPISLARQLLEPTAHPQAVDLSTPERAAMSCWRAMELGSAAIGDCFDWDAEWDLYVKAAIELERRLGQRMPELHDPEAKAKWIAAAREATIRRVKNGRCSLSNEPSEPPSDPLLSSERTRLQTEKDKAHERLSMSWRSENGLTDNLHDDSVLIKVIHMGFRVESVALVGGDNLAWVKIAGRNTDGTPFHFSEIYALRNGNWLQRAPPSKEELALLPQGWPPPLDDLELFQTKRLLALLEKMAGRPRC